MGFATRLLGPVLLGSFSMLAAASPPLDESEVLRVVREAVSLRHQVPVADVDVTWEGPPLSRLLGSPLPSRGSGRLRLEGASALTGLCSPRLVWEAGGVRRTFFPRVQVGMRREVLVMNAPLRKGSVFSTTMCRRANLVADRDLDAPVLDAGPFEGAIARREIASGSVLTPDMFDLPILVRSGRTVSVKLVSGGLLVLTQGRVVTDGRLGQLVRLVNPESRHEFTARVVGPDQVEVRLDQEVSP
ncbi:MAG: flagellar basal body P-ring formation chaperone FlgA [bacterium]|nr:flagellar basal body P-ring formation chaperone FlgA [bacterium]